jgi:hypothetical protein
MRVLLAVVLVVFCAATLVPALADLWLGPAATLAGHWDPRVDALDFNVFYAAGHLVLHGDGTMMYHPSSLSAQEHAHNLSVIKPEDTLPYLNPPFFALLVAPLGLLSFARAYQLWTVGNAVLLALTCWLTWDSTRALSRPWRAALIIAFVTALPVALTLQLGQFSLLLTACWTLAYRQFREGRDERGGFALVPLLIKPEMLLPLAVILVWRRRLRALQTLVPCGAVAVAVSFGVVGLEEGLRYPAYLFHNASRHVHGTDPTIMFGWNGLLDNFVSVNAGVETALALPFSIASLGIAGRCWSGRMRIGTDDLAAPWLVATIATLLMDPHLYFQDLAMLAPAAAIYLAHAPAEQRLRTSMAVAAGWCVLALGFMPNTQWGVNLFTPFLVVVFGLVAVRTARRPGGLSIQLEATTSGPEPLPRAA